MHVIHEASEHLLFACFFLLLTSFPRPPWLVLLSRPRQHIFYCSCSYGGRSGIRSSGCLDQHCRGSSIRTRPVAPPRRPTTDGEAISEASPPRAEQSARGSERAHATAPTKWECQRPPNSGTLSDSVCGVGWEIEVR